MPKLRGRVVAGMGNFSIWIERLRDHYRSKTGMMLFPGTLNLQLDQAWFVPPGSLRLEGAEYGGTVTVNIVPCSVFGRPAFILRTTANDEGRGDHPQTIIEIASDIKLRDAHQLKDGDWVDVEVANEAIAS
jgi:riboflavin kinase